MVQIDSREKNNGHITKYFDDLGVPYIRSKLYVGDYCSLDKPRFCIERKASILEFAGNVGKGHSQFKTELTRLDAINGRMIILIEELTPIETWTHKRSQMSGKKIAQIVEKWKTKHNVEVVQCEKADAGRVILDLFSKVQK